MDVKYKVAIIGCGVISTAHIKGYRLHPQLNIVAAADVSEDNLGKVCGEFNIRGQYTDYKEMLLSEKPDIVSICTWPGLHREMAIAAAQTGTRAILCEKPMCLSLGEADAMIDACRNARCKLAVAHQHRFHPRFVKARELIEQGAIGQPRMAWNHIAGGLMNNGTHCMNMLQFLLGDPPFTFAMANIERKTDRINRGHRVEDAMAAVVGFEGDIRVILETDTPLSEPNRVFRVVGTEGIIEVGWETLRMMNRGRPEGLSHEMQVEAARSHELQAAELIAWMDGTVEHRNNETVSRSTMEILMAIFESARTHSLIRPPVTQLDSPIDLMIDAGAFMS